MQKSIKTNLTMISENPSKTMNTETKPKVSVIIPVWNTGSYISKCVESLRRQTLQEIEMIFVDDCGTDCSMEIVRAASKEDSRIKIIKNPTNSGAGPSRNAGIREASGEYLSFIDSDDYIEDDFLETLFLLAAKEDLDIVKGTCIMKNMDGSIVPSRQDLNDIIKKGLEKGKPLYAIFKYNHHGALFRSSFIKENNVWYGSSARSQDDTFLLRACSRTNRFNIADDAYYYFCERADSAMHRENASSLEGSLLSVSERVDEVILNLLDDPESMPYLTTVFKNAVREYERYAQTADMETETKDYLRKLRLEMLRIPFCDQMAKRSFSLYMLKEEGVGLPCEPYRLPWEYIAPPEAYARLIAIWQETFEQYPTVRKKGIRDFSALIKQAKESSSYYKDHHRTGCDAVKKSIRRIPFNLRGYMAFDQAKRIAKQIIRR